MNATDSGVWKLEGAKVRFSELVRRARLRPQRVTLRGKDTVVVVSSEEFKRMQPETQCGLVELMANSPLGDVKLSRKEYRMPVREVRL